MRGLGSQDVPSLAVYIGIAYGLNWSLEMEKQRPYITAAMLCEKVLEEKNGSLSIIHVADRLGYRAISLPPGMEVPANTRPLAELSGLISLKSGPLQGDFKLTLVVERPDGKRNEAFSHSVKLTGNDQGQNIILNLAIAIELDGLYWFDVIFDGDLLTRIPLTVAREPEPVPQVQP